jgi:hypothetical protein
MRNDAVFALRLLIAWLFVLGSIGGAFLAPSIITGGRWSAFNQGHTFLPCVHRQSVLFSARSRLVASTQPGTLGVNDEQRWFPRAPKVVYDDDIYGAAEDEEKDDNDHNNDNIEARAVKLLVRLLQQRLGAVKSSASINETATSNPAMATDNPHASLVKGRFIDLTCTEEGERILESLFHTVTKDDDPQVIQAAVMAMQSILVLGTQVGVKGSPVQLQQMVAHLDSRGDQQQFLLRDLETWDTSSVRRLKYQQNREPGSQVLSALTWKRNTQGAFDLLVAIGAWGKHEDLALLRSGFSLRFNDKELQSVHDVSSNTVFTRVLSLFVAT